MRFDIISRFSLIVFSISLSFILDSALLAQGAAGVTTDTGKASKKRVDADKSGSARDARNSRPTNGSTNPLEPNVQAPSISAPVMPAFNPKADPATKAAGELLTIESESCPIPSADAAAPTDSRVNELTLRKARLDELYDENGNLSDTPPRTQMDASKFPDHTDVILHVDGAALALEESVVPQDESLFFTEETIAKAKQQVIEASSKMDLKDKELVIANFESLAASMREARDSKETNLREGVKAKLRDFMIDLGGDASWMALGLTKAEADELQKCLKG
jgi:hypothetical protein